MLTLAEVIAVLFLASIGLLLVFIRELGIERCIVCGEVLKDFRCWRCDG